MEIAGTDYKMRAGGFETACESTKSTAELHANIATV
jgi:hypothetical protein